MADAELSVPGCQPCGDELVRPVDSDELALGGSSEQCEQPDCIAPAAREQPQACADSELQALGWLSGCCQLLEQERIAAGTTDELLRRRRREPGVEKQGELRGFRCCERLERHELEPRGGRC